jgi:N-acetylglucosaminyldiphosphoundecaprenol N-acetyl-beta-D-mannosaminyltransferase
MKIITSVKVLGTKISIVSYPELLNIIENKIKRGSNYVCVAAVHLVMEAHQNNALRKFINKSLLTTADGMPLVWIAKQLLKRKIKRIYGPTVMIKLCKLAENKQYKVFLLGGAIGQSKDLINNLTSKYPKLKIVGFEETPIRPLPKNQNIKLVKKIKTLKPDIIFVGLGCPLQEKWIFQNYLKFNKGIFIGVGAAFDFISKRVKQAPKWIQNSGLEWLFRFLQDPLRLWKRYLIYNAKFIYLAIKHYKSFHAEKNTLY